MDVRVKLNLVPNLVEGKRIIIVDDSIVGTTSQSRIKILKEAGAKEVHVLISCPPHKHSCVYGIDFPDRKNSWQQRRLMRRFADIWELTVSAI